MPPRSYSRTAKGALLLVPLTHEQLSEADDFPVLEVHTCEVLGTSILEANGLGSSPLQDSVHRWFG